MQMAALSIDLIESMFVEDEVVAVPSAADRYGYKKVGGSSDTRTTADVFD